MDPPWGGVDYKSHAKVPLFLSGAALHDLGAAFGSLTRYVALKLPLNADIGGFEADYTAKVVLNKKYRKLRVQEHREPR